MKKRQIKKIVKQLSDYDLYEYVAYSNGHWKHFSHKEFDKRFGGCQRIKTEWEEIKNTVYNIWEKVICEICDKEFEGENGQPYCSKDCYKKLVGDK